VIGITVYAMNELGKWLGELSKGFPSIDQVRSDCTPGETRSEPATGVRHRGGTVYEQEFYCPDGQTYTMQWIVRDGKTIHGPHLRRGFFKIRQ